MAYRLPMRHRNASLHHKPVPTSCMSQALRSRRHCRQAIFQRHLFEACAHGNSTKLVAGWSVHSIVCLGTVASQECILGRCDPLSVESSLQMYRCWPADVQICQSCCSCLHVAEWNGQTRTWRLCTGPVLGGDLGNSGNQVDLLRSCLQNSLCVVSLIHCDESACR